MDFKTLRQKFCDNLVLTLPEGVDDILVYFDASIFRLGVMLMYIVHVIVYASRQLNPHEENYPMHDLEPRQWFFSLMFWRH